MDVRMPDLDGLSVLEKARETRPDLPVVMMSGHGSIETVRSAFKLGAFDYLEKPITEKEKLLVAVKNALALRSLREENARLRREAGPLEMVGSGPAMQSSSSSSGAPRRPRGACSSPARTAPARSSSRARSTSSSRRRGRALREAQLRGGAGRAHRERAVRPRARRVHRRGRRRGAASSSRPTAARCFLDEVGDMPPAMQAKLLRVLQEGEFERVGGHQTLKVDVRVVAATNKDLEAEVKAGRFREDLYYRLNVVPIHAPPLRERREDVPELAARFLAEACERNGRRPMSLSREARASSLQAHDWPGNVRELRNLVERLAILCDGPEIGADDVAAVLPGARRPRADRFRAGASFHDLVEEAEREIILARARRARRQRVGHRPRPRPRAEPPLQEDARRSASGGARRRSRSASPSDSRGARPCPGGHGRRESPAGPRVSGWHGACSLSRPDDHPPRDPRFAGRRPRRYGAPPREEALRRHPEGPPEEPPRPARRRARRAWAVLLGGGGPPLRLDARAARVRHPQGLRAARLDARLRRRRAPRCSTSRASAARSSPSTRCPRCSARRCSPPRTRSFYEHQGVNYLAIARCAVKGLLRGGVACGGSTITQQVVKTFLLSSRLEGEAQGEGARPRAAPRGEPHEGRDPLPLPEPDLLRAPALRRRGGEPLLLREAGEGPRASARRRRSPASSSRPCATRR